MVYKILLFEFYYIIIACFGYLYFKRKEIKLLVKFNVDNKEFSIYLKKIVVVLDLRAEIVPLISITIVV